jgi:hypothetical protein
MLEILERLRLEWSDRDDPGVVDQDIHVAEALHGLIDQVAGLVAEGHIARHRQDLCPDPFNVRPRSF